MKAVELLQNLVASVEHARTAHREVQALIPEQDTNWPKGYNFEELEKAQDEEYDADIKLRELIEYTKQFLKEAG